MSSLTLKEFIYLFDNKYYSQIDGVVMVSPLGPTLANIFLCYHESKWLKDCLKYFKPVYYKRYVDEHAQFFSHEHDIFNLRWSKQVEAFLDVKVFRENEKFATSVFRKDTFSGVYTNFISFIPFEFKFGFGHASLNHCFNLSFDFLKFHHEVDKLENVVEKCIPTKVYW